MSADVCLDDLLELVSVKVTQRKDPRLSYVGLEHLAQGEPKILGSLPAHSSTSTNSVFRPADILFGKLRPNLRKCAPVDFTGYCSTDILVLRPRPGVHPTYAAHLMRSEDVFAEAVRTAEGTKMPRTSWARLSKFAVARADPDEQVRVAEALDAADASVEAASRRLWKLDGLRQGAANELLFNRVETVQTRYGAIPPDWPVRPLSDMADVAGGVTLGRELPTIGTLELPYLRVANVQDGYLDLSEIKTVRIRPSEQRRYELAAGDVLMNEGGDFDKLGRGTVWSGEIQPCLHQNHVFRVRCDRTQLLPEYLALLSASSYGRRYFVACSKQSTNLASINSTQLKAFPVPWAQPDEQLRIVELLAGISAAIAAESARHHKLRQLRSGLVRELLGTRSVPSTERAA